MSIKVLEDARPHPARDASIRSITCVESGDREGWLSLAIGVGLGWVAFVAF